MTLNDLLEKFTNASFLLTVSELCDEWYGGVDELLHDDYFSEMFEKYRDREVKSIAILSTNFTPELCVKLGGKKDV